MDQNMPCKKDCKRRGFLCQVDCKEWMEYQEKREAEYKRRQREAIMSKLSPGAARTIAKEKRRKWKGRG